MIKEIIDDIANQSINAEYVTTFTMNGYHKIQAINIEQSM